MCKMHSRQRAHYSLKLKLEVWNFDMSLYLLHLLHVRTTVSAIYNKFCWVGKHVNIIMKPSNSPTQQKIGWRWQLGNFFPQQIVFGELGLVLCRKQTTRNVTQPDSPQTRYYFCTFVFFYGLDFKEMACSSTRQQLINSFSCWGSRLSVCQRWFEHGIAKTIIYQVGLSVAFLAEHKCLAVNA